MTGAARVDGEIGVWAIAVTPDSREELSIALAPTEDCAADGAVCTSDGRALSSGAAAIVFGPPERNTAATGTPAISGTPQVGEELTASTSGISDSDGLDDARFAYQWIRTGADIGGGDRIDLHAGGGRRGQEAEGPGELHRRRRPRGEPHQRGDSANSHTSRGARPSTPPPSPGSSKRKPGGTARPKTELLGSARLLDEIFARPPVRQRRRQLREEPQPYVPTASRILGIPRASGD